MLLQWRSSREVLQLTLSPCIHATAGLRISDWILCSHSEMKMVWVSLGSGHSSQELSSEEKGGSGRVLPSVCRFLFPGKKKYKGKLSTALSLISTAVFEEIHGIACNTTEQSENTWRTGRHCSQLKWLLEGWVRAFPEVPMAPGSILEFGCTSLPTCQMGNPSLPCCKGKVCHLCSGKSRRSLEPCPAWVKSAYDLSRLAETVSHGQLAQLNTLLSQLLLGLV